MEKFIKCKIQMLPTVEASRLRWENQRLQYNYQHFPASTEYTGNRYVYITIPTKVKEGDYFFTKADPQILRYAKPIKDGFVCSVFLGTIHEVVVATTDPKLGLNARPSNGFLTKYAELQGVLDLINVPFVYDYPEVSQCMQAKECLENKIIGTDTDICKDGCVQDRPVFRPKTAPDGTISIKRLDPFSKSELFKTFRDLTSSDGVLNWEAFILKLADDVRYKLPTNWKGE